MSIINDIPEVVENKILYPLTGETSVFENHAEATRFFMWHPLVDKFIYHDGHGDKYLVTKTKIK